ncbi:MAG: ABC transporter ATP-binding protein/permease [Myxacorys californica WJT36-NPBG1]|jgi:subfamily B ATP-binding cassette protein MsbA|nr:ABC transporter ATP-binding protein/permease [Myxacorys californica WJT36-NPBG1]
MSLIFSNLLRKLLKPTAFWQNNYIILREFKYFPQLAILAIVFSLLAALLEGVGIGLLLSFLQSLTTPGTKVAKTGMGGLDALIFGTDSSATSQLYRISIVIVLTTWMRAAFSYLSAVFVERTQLKLLDRLRKRIFEQLQAVQLSYFAKTRSGELINTITTQTEQLKSIFGGIAYLLTRILATVTYLISMFLISWQLSLISLLLLSLLSTALSTLNKRVRQTGFAVSAASGRFTSIAIELINGIRTVQAFATNDFERQRYYRASGEIVSTSSRAVAAMTSVKPLGEGFSTTILIGLIAWGYTVLVPSGALQVGSLLTFFFVLFRLVPVLQEFNSTRANLSFMKGAADNVKALLRSEDKDYFQNGSVLFPGLKRSIDLVAVDFGYEPTNLVLRDITLSIEQGKMTALVGASGAGKTTLADLIPRFYDPTQGQILIDGVDIRRFEITSLRRKLAVVSQDTFIFNTTVFNNIAYGTDNATEAEIIEAARLANALEFIQDMPEGFDTLLGDRGVRLSGGQRQRLAIARALLRKPEILILDEATSALDSVSEQLIQKSLEDLSVGRTVIAIAHRLSTIVRADKVVVLEQGHIVEQGTYQDLLVQRGKLWNYHQLQH